LAADRGVRVFTVGVGTEEGSVLRFGQRSMRVQLDEESLKRIADITRAKYFRATSADELTEIYKQLSTQLVMKREETEITALFTAAAALFAFIAVFLSFLWFHRIGLLIGTASAGCGRPADWLLTPPARSARAACTASPARFR